MVPIWEESGFTRVCLVEETAFKTHYRHRKRKKGTMGTSHYRYPVKLTSEQRKFLSTMVLASRTPAKH